MYVDGGGCDAGDHDGYDDYSVAAADRDDDTNVDDNQDDDSVVTDDRHNCKQNDNYNFNF